MIRKRMLSTILLVFAFYNLYAQTPTNSFPDTGTVSVGTVSSPNNLQVSGIIAAGGIISNSMSINYSNLFAHENISEPQFGFEWLSDPWQPNGPSFWLSGWSGMKFFTGSYPRMGITATGSVGIGTLTPQALLEVDGNQIINGASTGSSSYLQFKNAGTPVGILGSDGSIFGISASDFGIYTYGNNNFDISTNNVKRIRVTGAGNIGIGTLNPQSLLSVEGVITAKELNITQANWSDFVFDSAYKRMPLDKVASYVREYKHLPDIPSAVQIERRGLDLGVMECLHMQKIEELTLYAIDADRRINKQDSTIIDQQQQLRTQQDLLLRLQEQLTVEQKDIQILKQEIKAQR